MTSTKSYQFFDPPPPPSTKINNRSIVSKQWKSQTRDKFQDFPTPFCVYVINDWSHIYCIIFAHIPKMNSIIIPFNRDNSNIIK